LTALKLAGRHVGLSLFEQFHVHGVHDCGLTVTAFTDLCGFLGTALEGLVQEDGGGTSLKFSTFGFEKEVNGSLRLKAKVLFSWSKRRFWG
jgi:hypothetical protein